MDIMKTTNNFISYAIDRKTYAESQNSPLSPSTSWYNWYASKYIRVTPNLVVPTLHLDHKQNWKWCDSFTQEYTVPRLFHE